MNVKYNVYLVSDSTGETLDRIFLSIKSQFSNFNYNKKHFLNIFETDFKKSLDEYEKYFKHKNHTIKEKELLIEMLFQLGPNNVSKFKRMLCHLNQKNKYMTCLEMMNSLWFKQTPKRVINLIENFLRNK